MTHSWEKFQIDRPIDKQSDSEAGRQMLIGLRRTGVPTFTCFSFTGKATMIEHDGQKIF